MNIANFPLFIVVAIVCFLWTKRGDMPLESFLFFVTLSLVVGTISREILKTLFNERGREDD